MKISGKIITGLTFMIIISFSSGLFAQPSKLSGNAMFVAKIYDWFLNGNIPGVLDAMDPDIEWNSAESSPYSDGSPYIGPTAVLEGIFYRLGSE